MVISLYGDYQRWGQCTNPTYVESAHKVRRTAADTAMKTDEQLYALTVDQLNSEYTRLGHGQQRTKYGKSVWGHISMKQTTDEINSEHALIEVPVSVITMYKKTSKFLLGRKDALMFVPRGETLTPYGSLRLRDKAE